MSVTLRGRSASARYAIAVAVLASAIGAGTAFAGGGQSPPEISGIPQEGQTLFASADTSTDNWQWERCSNSTVEDCEPPGRGGQFWDPIPGADEDTYVLTSADVGDFIRVVAYDDFSSCARGVLYCNPRFSDPVGPIQPAPPPPPAGGPSPAVAHVSANLTPLTGTILVKLPGTDFFIPITQATQIPLGSVIDATDGHVLVTTARNEQNDQQSSESWAGIFKLTQTEGTPLITKFDLVGPGEEAGRAQRGRSGRRLWGRGRCKCRTRGRHSSATVRGTWWLTAEKKNGTLTRVKRGKVSVRDFGRRKAILVKAGERYLARRGSK